MDTKSGRYYWPRKLVQIEEHTKQRNTDRLRLMIEHLIPNFKSAISYTLNLSGTTDAGARVRLFCALPLSMAILTADLAVTNGEYVFNDALTLKIDRDETLRVHERLKDASHYENRKTLNKGPSIWKKKEGSHQG